jgi:hypothetical protein
LYREKGYYSNVEVLEGIIRSRFSGTATCVGNPSLRQGDRSIVEVSIGTVRAVSLYKCDHHLIRSTNLSPCWCPPGVQATTGCLQERRFFKVEAVVPSVARNMEDIQSSSVSSQDNGMKI